jgi:hypothetical protein
MLLAHMQRQWLLLLQRLKQVPSPGRSAWLSVPLQQEPASSRACCRQVQQRQMWQQQQQGQVAAPSSNGLLCG